MSKTAAVDSTYAWWRLAVCLALTTVGSAGMYVVVVALPAFQSEFAISRAGASIPFTMVMVGFGIGGIVTGRLVDRYGVARPLAGSAIALGLAFVGAARADSFLMFALMHIMIGWCGCAAVFGPLVADVSKWFLRRRGLAVAIGTSGNYLAGALWPRPIQHMIAEQGWRHTYIVMGLLGVAIMLPLVGMLRRRPQSQIAQAGGGGTAGTPAALGLTPTSLTVMLCLAGIGCCVAMAMPQVHLVSLCADRGFGAARGAEMLSLLLGCGIISRLVFGLICDRLGGLRTLLISSSLQCLALVLFLPATGMTAMYLVAALFGLFQGGIVPCYAIITREYFPEREAGSRIGLIIFATILGMAIGGWGAGAIFDATGSYTVAFIHGIGWNLLNLWVVLLLLSRVRVRRPGADHALVAA